MKRFLKIKLFIVNVIGMSLFSLALVPAMGMAQMSSGSQGDQYDPINSSATITMSNANLPSTGVMVWLLVLLGVCMVAAASFVLIGANRRS